MLKHPCIAQRCLDEWHTMPQTASLTAMALNSDWGGKRETPRWQSPIVITFEDDTSLRITGRGRAHKVEVLFP